MDYLFSDDEITSDPFFKSFEGEDSDNTSTYSNYSRTEIELSDSSPLTEEESEEEKEDEKEQDYLNDKGESNINSNNNCPICLQGFQDRSYLNPCYHSFCNLCIQHWLTVTPNCPLCKSDAEFVVHNVDEDKGTFIKFQVAGNIKRDEKQIKKLKHKKWITEIISSTKSLPTSASSHSLSSLSASSSSLSSKKIRERSQIYDKNLLAKDIPQRFIPHSFSIKDRERLRPFVLRDLKAILKDTYDQIIGEYVLSTLISYYENYNHHHNNNRHHHHQNDSRNNDRNNTSNNRNNNNNRNNIRNNINNNSRNKHKSQEEIIERLKPWLGNNNAKKLLEETFKFFESGLTIEDWDRLVSY